VKNKVYAIIVAAGKGLRLQGVLRKQYLALDGVPILRHTLNTIDGCEQVNQIILVAPKEDLDFCRNEFLMSSELQKDVRLVAGGSERQDSVFNGLNAIESDDGIVLIHDGVRPFVRRSHLTACINGAAEFGACILGIPAFDTVKQVSSTNEITQTLKRDNLWLAQTPQAFQLKLIKKAHEAAKQEGFVGTDDASLVERLGEVVKIIPGSRSNIKITDREDLKLAQALFQINAPDL
jgi:2-C-methyl-D-erythritol 4-phosphate cytidylyltransferase